MQYAIGGLCGSLVGATLGLVGGGGSILAVPLIVYVVGIANPHIAIGTSAVAVATNAALNLVAHSRAGNVKWRCASVFAIAGVLGAAVGSTLGKMFDGQRLLALFSILMIGVGGLMLHRRSNRGESTVTLRRDNAGKLILAGIGAGGLSGFFGIGGGFLVVPGLIAATNMPILNAVGSSLLAVAAFGTTTAASYADSGLVDWRLAAALIIGGIVGGILGTHYAQRLSARRGSLNVVLATMIMAVGAYTLYRSACAITDSIIPP